MDPEQAVNHQVDRCEYEHKQQLAEDPTADALLGAIEGGKQARSSVWPHDAESPEEGTATIGDEVGGEQRQGEQGRQRRSKALHGGRGGGKQVGHGILKISDANPGPTGQAMQRSSQFLRSARPFRGHGAGFADQRRHSQYSQRRGRDSYQQDESQNSCATSGLPAAQAPGAQLIDSGGQDDGQNHRGINQQQSLAQQPCEGDGSGERQRKQNVRTAQGHG